MIVHLMTVLSCFFFFIFFFPVFNLQIFSSSLRITVFLKICNLLGILIFNTDLPFLSLFFHWLYFPYVTIPTQAEEWKFYKIWLMRETIDERYKLYPHVFNQKKKEGRKIKGRKKNTRTTASISKLPTSNNNKKSPTYSLTINHITVFVLKINKKQNMFIEWVIAMYRIKNYNNIDLIIKPILAVWLLLDRIKYRQKISPKDCKNVLNIYT